MSVDTEKWRFEIIANDLVESFRLNLVSYPRYTSPQKGSKYQNRIWKSKAYYDELFKDRGRGTFQNISVTFQEE